MHIESTQNLHNPGMISGNSGPMTMDAHNTISSSALDQHQTYQHGGGFTASGYGGTLSHTSIGIGVNAPYPVSNILGLVAPHNLADMPTGPLGMMNVSIRGQRKQLQQKKKKKGMPQEQHDKTVGTAADVHFMNTQISHPPTMLKKPVLSVA